MLYEMVTGQRAFQGKTYSSLVGAILSAEPAPMAVKPFTPSWLERLVRRCLEKDPDDRYQSMRDLSLDLKSPPAEPVAAAAAQARRWPWAAGAVLALGLGALAGSGWVRKPSAAPQASAFYVNPTPGSRFAPISNAGGSAISPDGRTLVFVAVDSNGTALLHLCSIDSIDSRGLPGTEGAGRPFWSPDSKSVAFVAGGKLKRLDLRRGRHPVWHAGRGYSANRGGRRRTALRN